MKKIKSRKGLAIAFGALVLAFVLAVFIISPLTKYLLEKYDVDLIGREITMDWAYVNPFSGYVHLNDLKVYEEKGDSIFISVEGVSANVALLKLFSRTIELTQLTLDRPHGKIVQRHKVLNFSDVIDKFTRKEPGAQPSKWHFSFLHTNIIDGEFQYRELIIPINYSIKNVNIESSGRKWDVDTLAAKFSFQDGKGNGDVKGDFTVDLNSNDYQLAVAIHDYDLEIIRQYIWELINYGMFKSRLDARLQSRGNFSSEDNVTTKGWITLRNFHLGKTTQDDYMSFDKLVFAMEEVSPMKSKYLLDSIILYRPYLKYEIYDSLDNVQAMFGKAGKNISDVTGQSGRFNLVIEIARYIKVLSRNFFTSDYKIGLPSLMVTLNSTIIPTLSSYPF